MELILIPNCSLLYVHSNDRINLKSKGKVIAMNIIVIKTTSNKNPLLMLMCKELRHVKNYHEARASELSNDAAWAHAKDK